MREWLRWGEIVVEVGWGSAVRCGDRVVRCGERVVMCS